MIKSLGNLILIILSSIPLHSPERMTVNHDVTGSSPVGGATKAVEFFSTAFSYI